MIGAAIPALSTQAQASAGETADLVDLIRRTGVGTIYPEAGVSAELEQAIADEAGAKVGGELWADTLGPEGSGGATYIGAHGVEHERAGRRIQRRFGAMRPRRMSSAVGRGGALRALAPQDHVVVADDVVEPLAELVDRALELRVLERA